MIYFMIVHGNTCANLAPSLCFAGFPCVTPHKELVKSYKSVGCVPPRLKFLFRTFDRLSYTWHDQSSSFDQTKKTKNSMFDRGKFPGIPTWRRSGDPYPICLNLQWGSWDLLTPTQAAESKNYPTNARIQYRIQDTIQHVTSLESWPTNKQNPNPISQVFTLSYNPNL